MSNNKNTRSNNKRRNPRGRRNPRFGSARPNQIYSMTFPREMKVSMLYNEVQTLTPSAGLARDYVFNLNSIFDPDSTGTGHQPMGRDQWALFYGRYRVDQCKITVRCVRSDGGTITILGNNTSSAITNVADALESPVAKTGAHGPNGAPLTLTKAFNLASLTGVTRSVYNADDRYQASFGSSPTEVLCGHVVWVDSALATGVAFVSIQITYLVTMFDPIQQGQS